MSRFNKYRSPGAKRLMLEAQELKETTEDYCAQPIDDNLFEWHFTVRGPPDTAFDGGYYHGRLSFPTEYPMKPPSIILLTPNGRFETNRKICLSISGYHPETWQPSWSVRTALLALIAFMPTQPHKAIGSLDYSDIERKILASKSRSWRCETCGLIRELLRPKPRSDPTNYLQQQLYLSPPSSSGSSSSDSDDAQSLTNPDPPTLEQASQQLEVQVADNNIRRAYPPLVMKSIFVLLSLLILRRVVMVILS